MRCRMRIKGRQIDGIKRLAQVGGIRNQGIGQACRQRQVVGGIGRPDRRVRRQRNPAAHRRQGHERDLFHHQPPAPRASDRTTSRDATGGLVADRLAETGRAANSRAAAAERNRDEHRLGHQAQRKESGDRQIARQRGPLGVAAHRPEREHEKQPAQHVPSLGHPGHRFDMQRMNGKDRRHPGAGPKIAGHPQQDQEQQHRRRRVQQHVGQIVPAGFSP